MNETEEKVETPLDRNWTEGELWCLSGVTLMVICGLLLGWIIWNANTRWTADSKNKADVVEAMINSGKTTEEVKEVLDKWNGQSTADKRAELARHLKTFPSLTNEEINRTVMTCYPEPPPPEEKKDKKK
jgi:hypothetical protein